MRLYWLVAINEKTGNKTYLTTKPFGHAECVTMKKRFSPHPLRRIQLEEVAVEEIELTLPDDPQRVTNHPHPVLTRPELLSHSGDLIS